MIDRLLRGKRSLIFMKNQKVKISKNPEIFPIDIMKNGRRI